MLARFRTAEEVNRFRAMRICTYVRTTVSHLLKASLVTDNFFHQTLDLRIRFVHAYVCSDSSIGRPGEERAAAAQPYYRERIRRGRQTDRAGQARAYACRHASESVGRRSSRQTDKTDKTDKTGNQAVGQEAPSSLTDSRSSLPCLKLMKLNVLHREHTCHIYQTAIQPSNNAIFLSHLYIKTIISPRQARDKHRENSPKRHQQDELDP
jgi:hypothetical protein